MVSREEVAAAVGVSIDALVTWEAAVQTVANVEQPGPAQAIRIDSGGKANPEALHKWGFQFFPGSNTWRRARASRNEVSRAQVARRLGVSEEDLLRWEEAVARRESGQADPL